MRVPGSEDPRSGTTDNVYAAANLGDMVIASSSGSDLVLFEQLPGGKVGGPGRLASPPYWRALPGRSQVNFSSSGL